MSLAALFVLGIFNVAASKAVLASDHLLVGSLPRHFRQNGGRLTILTEFCVLISAMLLLDSGFTAAGWIYAVYSFVTLGFAWLVIARRI